MIKIAICDDEPVVLESLRLCIEKQPLVKSVQVFSTMEKFQKEIELEVICIYI